MAWRDPGTPDERVAAVRAGFAAAYDAPPERVGFAPGRVNLIGEHTDYTGGLCLPLALPHRTYVALTPRADGVVRVRSAQVSGGWEGDLADAAPGAVAGWSAYVVGVLAELRDAGFEVGGVDLLVDSTVPVGAGLSSSAALECAVAVAALGGIAEDERQRVIDAARRAEGRWAGAPTGGLDQTIAVRGRPGDALLIDFRDGSTHLVPVAWEASGLTLLVVDTRVSHALSDGAYGDRRASCEQAAALLGGSLRDATSAQVEGLADPVLRARARHITSENARVVAAERALLDGDWRALGALMLASHASLRDEFAVSCAELDLVVETAMANGALGARMTGGGFGGSAIALIETDLVQGLLTALLDAFGGRDWGEPDWLLAAPSGGADLA